MIFTNINVYEICIKSSQSGESFQYHGIHFTITTVQDTSNSGVWPFMVPYCYDYLAPSASNSFKDVNL